MNRALKKIATAQRKCEHLQCYRFLLWTIDNGSTGVQSYWNTWEPRKFEGTLKEAIIFFRENFGAGHHDIQADNQRGTGVPVYRLVIQDWDNIEQPSLFGE